jgi:putative transposase
MPSTYSQILFHLIFATKNREPLILDAWRPQLHEYLGSTVVGLGGTALAVGGVRDHVHLLVGLKPTHRLSDFMRELKKASSVWVGKEIGATVFAWQEGYGAFTVSASARDSVRNYIRGQEEHHRRKTSRLELVEILRQCEVAYEDRYLD